ncbi:MULTISPECIES: hypothetical protein [unclassified Sphingopyxis]|uniref:hypothetical protein n=1 Tax=unclassified Sphingopyxis TaxID=2614943 RepID=UPI00285CC5E3|nr:MULTISPECIES: hypothetical protein [unclassified Sphingopyxis]MDR6832095.1 hypothetical protein [Sphingopyxis sp. BE122]MDR7227837.1 hypothetical protein [Sphingopyxis sp. BE259]
MAGELFNRGMRERDLDNFLVEELYASPEFRAWFVARAGKAFAAPEDLAIRLHKSPARTQDSRQTDVRIGWFADDSALKAAILIENKVGSGFQEGQAAAYAAEAQALRTELGEHAVATVLVAPKAQFSSLVHDGHFDGEIAIEDIVASLKERLRNPLLELELTARLTARIDLLEALCGRRSENAWTPVTIEAKRDFAKAYAELAGEILPLIVRPSTDGPKALTRIFEPVRLRPDLLPVVIRHEFGSNVATKYVNAQFAGQAELLPLLSASGIMAGTGYTLRAAGKSLAIDVATPGIDPTLPFEMERAKVLEGLEAIGRLVEWLTGSAEQLAQIFLGEGSEQGKTGGVASPEQNNRVDPHRLAREFEAELLSTYRECEKLGYRPTGMLDLMERLGAIATARHLLARPPSDGFARLFELNRLDLAIESIVLRPEWSSLFSDHERGIARRRLR